MSNLGKYQDIVEAAHQAGGPSVWLDTIKKSAYTSGASNMKNKLVAPVLIIGIGIGSIGVISYQNIKNWVSKKREEKLLAEKEAEQAEKLLKKELDETIEELNTNTNSQ